MALDLHNGARVTVRPPTATVTVSAPASMGATAAPRLGASSVAVPVAGRGPRGPYGLSAYEVAVANGFQGGVAAWLGSLQGATGAASTVPGPPGPAGMTWRGTWAAGTDYVENDAVFYDGASWFASADPPQGEVPAQTSPFWWPLALQGQQGPAGADGDPGASGATAYELAVAGGFVGTQAEWLESLEGPRGQRMWTGNGAPGSIPGSIPGDVYLDASTGNVYELT